ncbi:salicylate 1-monooxygenase [Billgrantia tianxiuensis]|jgi:salicylate hydroxylase|uniref:Salicylate 1-monooxygenase n=1 Tax=Billgrantia tianxiuensis TaxID=2497861 RepID=A0A6I6SLU3_9GAMM|nr:MULTISPECIES: salicylate 1-monooxygenase [Halomonas]MCE8035487.1 salicylate 1-monooxygenase [Halomonas sp. MCCC 1A11057]QHC51619.1 salicylate 1-monooxygenase [Halomonas tianxiuensis]
MVSNLQPKRLSIGIVGGGIGGVAFAVALSRDPGLDVHLFEAAERFSEIGAGVSFGPNAVRAIQLLGLENSYRRIADASPAPFEDVWFEWRRGRDDAYLTASLAPGCGQSSVHRADFLDAIVANLPEGIAHFGKRCIEVQQNGEGATARFDDGTSFTADILIGYDGIKSAVREHVLPPARYGDLGPFWSGTYAYRGMIPTTQLGAALEEQGADRRLALVPQMYLGPDRHILTFPVKQSELINVVAFVTDRTTPNPRLPEGEEWVKAVAQQEMLEVFEGWGAASQAILACIPEPTRWALHELPELPFYHRDRVLIVGDAAHAMVPHQGAGAGQALEDAYVLASLLTDQACTRQNAQQALAAFEAVRHARACRVQRTSHEAGDLYEYSAPGIGADEARLAADLETRFDWLWNHDLRNDVAAARVRLGWESVASFATA